MNKRMRYILILAALALLAAAAVLFFGRPSAPPEPEEAVVTPADETVDVGHFTVKKTAGEAYYPEKGNWAYHFTYAYPRVEGEGYTAALINDTYEMALNEVKEIALPMFAGAQEGDGRHEVRHDFEIKCNTERLLSVLLKKSQTDEDGGTAMTLEAEVFNVYGDTAGDALTLRGALLVLAGADPTALGEVTAADLPDYPRIVAGSSDGMEEALLPRLYEAFRELQASGVCRGDADQADFEALFSPARDFYALPDGRIVFFLPPSLLANPGFDVPTFAYTPADIEGMI